MATYNGNNGNNTYTGTSGDDIINGFGGDDTLSGGDGNDILIGGTGNDFLSGGNGADIYVFAKGDGQDIISNYHTDSSVDIIKFTDVAVNDVTKVSRSSTDELLISYGVNDQVAISLQFDGVKNRIDQIQFSDGVVWRWQDIESMLLQQPTSGDDVLKGFNGKSNNLSGLAGNDSLYGGNRNDTLNGGLGNDFLQGGGGSDTYIIAKNDGQDVIDDFDSINSVDVVKFVDMVPADINQVKRTTEGLSLNYGNGSSLMVSLYFNDASYRVEQFQFSNGVVWSYDDIKPMVLQGTEGDDLLQGYYGEIANLKGLGGNDVLIGADLNDTLDGGEGNDDLIGGYGSNGGDDILLGGGGNDRLQGGNGNDILNGGPGNDILIGGTAGTDSYIFAKNDGQDVISEYIFSIIIFSDVASTEITGITRQAYDLFISYGNSDQLKFTLVFVYSNNYAEFRFSDGVVWSWADIRQKVLQGTGRDDNLYGYDGVNNNLSGLAGNDYMVGGNLGDTLDGGMGDDQLFGNGGNDMLIGGAGNDRLDGGDGSDTLIGGAGDDILVGGVGADTYVFAKNDGYDTIYDIDVLSAVNVVKFTDVASTDITRLSHGQYDLYLTYGNGSQLDISGYFYGTYHGLDQFQFSDGVTWDWQAIKQQIQDTKGTDGDDVLYAYDGQDTTLSGLAGNDKLYGGAANDTLIGGQGNDYLTGNGGSDTYVFAKNDGLDTIDDGSGDSSTAVDVIKFTDVASTDAVSFSRSLLNSNLVIHYGDNSQITLFRYFDYPPYYQVDKFQFSDGVTWTFADIKQKLLQPTNGDDTLLGYDGESNHLSGLAGNDTLIGGDLADTLNGGKGNDYLSGGDGSDTYLFAAGDGQDTIDNSYYDQGSTDVVQFTNVSLFGLTTITQTADIFGNESLVIRSEYGNQLTISNYFLGGAYQLNQFQFADGRVLNNFIFGSAVNDTLTGTDANDALLGLGGADTLSGGAGDDAYFVNSARDTVIEVANAGNDTIFSSVSLILAANVENLVLRAGAVNGQGNGLDNSLFGNNLANTLDGFAGNDQLNGGLGNDILDGGEGNDKLLGGAGNDVLDGGLGADVLKGGLGQDTFVFDSALGAGNKDVITDFSVTDDTIRLDHSVFTVLTGTGALAAAEFAVIGNGGVVGSTDHILYNTVSGGLFYDADGNGAGAAVLVALLGKGLAVTAADFMVV